jgi:hypothetical protein
VSQTSCFTDAKPMTSLVLPSGPLTADRISVACSVLWHPDREALLSEDLDGKIALTDIPEAWDIQ